MTKTELYYCELELKMQKEFVKKQKKSKKKKKK